MDSGNSSGSMQSSSGGDEEYDSRAESSISAFMINNPQPPQNNHVVGLGPFTISTTTTNSHALPPQQQHHHNTHMFDPLSNYLDPMQRSPSLPNSNSALVNLDMMWSKPTRSEPNQTDLGGLIPCSSQQNQQALLSGQVPGQTIRDAGAAFLATHHSLPDPQSASRGLLSVSAANNNDQPHNANTNTNMVRNPKKRSRASRRAPTTVLTTDTTNFRAMVQEFTGIPAPPFTSSPFPRTRFDLFGSAVSTSSTVRSTLLDPSPPPYLLRPFAQKLHHHHLNPFPPSTSSFPPSSNSMVDTLLASNNSNSTYSAATSTSINYQMSSSGVDHLGLLKNPLNFNNMHNNNPILSFQNILQAPPKYPLGNPSVLAASKTQQPSLDIPPPSIGDSHLKLGVFEELGLRHAHVNSNTNVLSGLHHQNMVSSRSVGALSSGNNNNNLSNASTEWAQRTGTITNNDCEHGGGGGLGGTVNYSDVAERVTNGKVHYSASSSDFRREKGTECTVAARSEGMVESWINCSSDN